MLTDLNFHLATFSPFRLALQPRVSNGASTIPGFQPAAPQALEGTTGQPVFFVGGAMVRCHTSCRGKVIFHFFQLNYLFLRIEI